MNAPLTLDELLHRSLELFFGGCKLILQAAMCFARIAAIHVRFVSVRLTDAVLAASEYIDRWEPVRLR